jgi:thioester reductase-like protein
MSNTILVTGATGNIGSKLVLQFLSGDVHDRLVLLVRGRSDADARRRMLDLLATLPGARSLGHRWHSVQVLAGDVTRDLLGLDKDTYESLCASLTHIVHAAASTCFTLPLASARAINYRGTVNVMKLAQRCYGGGRLSALAHVSTTYVNGPSGRPILEATLEERDSFFNSYDRTKWEAERFVRSRAGDLPVVVFRPCTVVGDADTGHTTSFNVLYAPLRLIARDRVRSLPGDPRTVLDVVPSDYVAKAIRHILLHAPLRFGSSYHLVAGRSQSLTVAEIVNEARRVFGVSKDNPPIRYLPRHPSGDGARPSAGNDARVDLLLGVFAPFTTFRWDFDSTLAREALRGSGISCPPFADYIRTCLDFCTQTNWGKGVSVPSHRSVYLEHCGDHQPCLARRFAERPASCA